MNGQINVTRLASLIHYTYLAQKVVNLGSLYIEKL